MQRADILEQLTTIELELRGCLQRLAELRAAVRRGLLVAADGADGDDVADALAPPTARHGE